MKHPIKRRDAGEMRILAITFIAKSTELLASAVHGKTNADVDAAIEKAVDLFVNQGEPIAQAITHGVHHARDRILHREALMLCALLMIFTFNA